MLILLAAAAAACHERTNEAAFSLPPIAVRVATLESQPMLVPARAVQLSHAIASVMVVGIVCMLAARHLLGEGRAASARSRPSIGNWAARYGLYERTHRLRVERGSELVGRRLGACSLDLEGEGRVVAIERSSRFARAVLHATPDHVVDAGDILLFNVDDKAFDIESFCARLGLERLAMSAAYFSDQARDVGMVEVIVPPESHLVNTPVMNSAALAQHGLSVMGIWRGSKALDRLHDAKLRVGRGGGGNSDSPISGGSGPDPAIMPVKEPER